MSLLNRCERSPSPVSVGENTLLPFASRRSDTRRQYQPPTQAPWISTKVFGVVCALAAPTILSPVAAVAASPAPAATPPIMIRRLMLWSVITKLPPLWASDVAPCQIRRDSFLRRSNTVWDQHATIVRQDG